MSLTFNAYPCTNGAFFGTHIVVRISGEYCDEDKISQTRCTAVGPDCTGLRHLRLHGETRDGAQTWQQVGLSGVSGRNNSSAVYDSNSNRIVVFGGYNPQVVVAFSKFVFWIPNPATFPSTIILAAPTGTPPVGRSGHTAVYDAANDRMIIFGGTSNTLTPSCQSDTWVLSNASGPVEDRAGFSSRQPIRHRVAQLIRRYTIRTSTK
jgi:hypothetical protein